MKTLFLMLCLFSLPAFANFEACFLKSDSRSKLWRYVDDNPASLRVSIRQEQLAFMGNKRIGEKLISEDGWNAQLVLKKKPSEVSSRRLRVRSARYYYRNQDHHNWIIVFRDDSVRSLTIRPPFRPIRASIESFVRGLQQPGVPARISFPTLKFVDHERDCENIPMPK